MEQQITDIVNALKLSPHPEGGFYKETYRSAALIQKSCLGDEFSGNRSYSTCIYYLLKSGSFSAFHRIKQDEIWHFYLGSSIELHRIKLNGTYTKTLIGNDIINGQFPQLVVEAGDWFAANVLDDDSFSLVGCTVSPGFDFDDFELAKRQDLINEFPQHSEIINKLSRT